MKKVLLITVLAAMSAVPASAETLVSSLNSPVAAKALARGEKVCTGWSTHGNRMCATKVRGAEVFDFQVLPETPTTTIVVKVKDKDCAADILSPNCIDVIALAAVDAAYAQALARKSRK